MPSSRCLRSLAAAILLAALGMPALVARPYASAAPDQGPPARHERAGTRQGDPHTETPVPGVTVTTLATATVDELQGVGIRFDRVPLEPGDSLIDALTPDEDDPWRYTMPGIGPFSGPQLLYIERGEVVVEDDGGETAYSQGEQLVMPAGAAYDIKNETGGCASFLRLVVEPRFGGGFGTNVGEPELAAQDCGSPRNLIGWSPPPVANLELPVQLFIAEIRWDPAEYEAGSVELGPHTHPGPTGLVLDAGTLLVGTEISHILSPGSVVLIPTGVTHSEYYPAPAGAEPAVALLAGVAPDGMALIGEADEGTAASGPDDRAASKPADLLPSDRDVPAGLVIVEDVERSLAEVTAGYSDPSDTERRFREWGWAGNAARTFSPDGSGVSALSSVYVSVHLFDGEASAGAALQFSIDSQAASTGAEEIAVRPIGDESRGLWVATVSGSEVTVYTREGPFLVRVTVTSFQGDPTADAEDVAARIVANAR